MSLDFRNIAHTSDREAIKFAIQGSCNRLPDARFSGSWWTNEADNLALYSALELTNSNKLCVGCVYARESAYTYTEQCRAEIRVNQSSETNLQDALLELLQPIMIFVENLFSLLDVK